MEKPGVSATSSCADVGAEVPRGTSIAYCLLCKGLPHVVQFVEKCLVYAYRTLVRALNALFGNPLRSLSRLYSELRKLISKFSSFWGTGLANALVAAVTSIVCFKVHFSSKSTGDHGYVGSHTNLATTLALLFGMFRCDSNWHIYVGRPQLSNERQVANSMASQALKSGVDIATEKQELRVLCTPDVKQNILKFLELQARLNNDSTITVFEMPSPAKTVSDAVSSSPCSARSLCGGRFSTDGHNTVQLSATFASPGYAPVYGDPSNAVLASGNFQPYSSLVDPCRCVTPDKGAYQAGDLSPRALASPQTPNNFSSFERLTRDGELTSPATPTSDRSLPCRTWVQASPSGLRDLLNCQ